MTVAATKLHHGLLVGGLLIVVAVVAFLFTTRGASYPNPDDLTRPIPALAARSQAEREFERTVFGLHCLDAMANNRYKPALEYCDLALRQSPDDVMLLKLRGNAYFFLGRPKAAIADFSHAAAIAPHDPDAYRFRGTVYSSLHRDAPALADFNRAIAIAPKDPVSLEFRGYFFEARGQYALAIADFLASIEAQPNNYHVWNSLCWTRFLARASDTEALAACDRSITLNPHYINSFDSRGFVLIRLGRYRAAIDDFSRALAINPNFASSLFGRGVAKKRIGDRSAGRDIAMARLVEPGIEARFIGYGIRLSATGRSGT
ncbi:MAG: tetratricopeptide repeat protein [Alphaproteobacteria bacterium]|nr:tetratricopeptide repeat protein [Alphaproteobacteria bacterium]MBL7097759.1 tetratricopeptide repeat protein [Alphaproteobacteria bacterium]